MRKHDYNLAMHRVGDRVQNAANGWYGRVRVVECMACGKSLVDDKCPEGHSLKPRMSEATGRVSPMYFITVAQDNVPGDMRPWCLPENFPLVKGPILTAWERLLADRLVPEG